MSSWVASVSFLSTALIYIASLKREKKKNTNEKMVSKEFAKFLRDKHFSKAVSVSYANSGPLMIVRGEGSRLIDEVGNSYLDTRNNVAHCGHNNPRVVKAIQEQVAVLNTNTRYLHPTICLLAERLSNLLPDPLEIVFFVNSGSEANDLALRLARDYTRSRNTIVCGSAYHGHTLATLEVSPYKYEHGTEFGLIKPDPEANFSSPGTHIWQVPPPDVYRGPYRDIKTAGLKYASTVQEACKFYQNTKKENVGAFIIEGGMSVAGVILPPPGYLYHSVKAVREAGGVYIADEVQTGFGRLGQCYWAFQHQNSCLEDEESVVPDIVTVGKPFGNGMPLAAVVTTRKIAEVFEKCGVEYFNTFGGNPVCASAGLAVLDTIEAEGLQQNAIDVGGFLKSMLIELRKRLDIIGDVRGSGLFIGIELVRDHDTLEAASAETSFICTTLKSKYNILSSIDGKYDHVLVVKPPMVFRREDADYFVQCFEKIVLEDLKDMDLKNMRKTPT